MQVVTKGTPNSNPAKIYEGAELARHAAGEARAGDVIHTALYRVLLGLLVSLSGCSGPATSGFLAAGKLARVIVGESSRVDVFAALGKPLKTERSSAGESWFYETTNGTGPSSGLVSGATTVSSVVGAFVPFAGLVGTGIGVANSARPTPDTMQLSVRFDADGIVVDCAQSSTAVPSGLPGADATPLADCTRRPSRR